MFIMKNKENDLCFNEYFRFNPHSAKNDFINQIYTAINSIIG